MPPFRDQQMPCPRCGKPLAHYPDREGEARDKWRCKTCNGALVGGEQLVVEIGPHAQEVLDGAADPARPALHPCPVCAFPMTPYTIGTIEVDRCVEHGLVWFDGGEIGKIRAAVPAENEDPLFTDAVGFIAQLRADEAALRSGALDELPLVEPQAPMTSGEWTARKVCSDGACNGVLVDGTCSECGKPATATESR